MVGKKETRNQDLLWGGGKVENASRKFQKEKVFFLLFSIFQMLISAYDSLSDENGKMLTQTMQSAKKRDGEI